MRVISGSYKSRLLEAPAGMETRPTSDRLRETLFNVLTNGGVDRIAEANFLDLYAGSGAVGIEALSRGAHQVTFVEQTAPAIKALEKNLRNLKIAYSGAAVKIEKRSVSRFLRGALEKPPAPFDVVFLDPPYESEAEYTATLSFLAENADALLAQGAIIVAEHRRSNPLPANYAALTRYRLLEQGDAALSFYRLDQPGSYGKASAAEP